MRIQKGTLLGAVAVATLVAGSSLTLGSEASAPSPAGTIAFPTEYRTWAHVKSALVGPQSPFAATQLGIHHIYANAPALEGYRTGKFPDGSFLVYDLIETIETNGSTQEGKQKRVDVMVKQGDRYRDSGGWGFASFPAGERTPAPLQATCFGCHARRADHDGVFSEFRTAAGAIDEPPLGGTVAAAGEKRPE